MAPVDEDSGKAIAGRVVAGVTLFVASIALYVSASADVTTLLDDVDKFVAERGPLNVFWTAAVALGVGLIWGLHNLFPPSRRFGAGVIGFLMYAALALAAIIFAQVPWWAAVWTGLAFAGAVIEDFCNRDSSI